MGSSSTRKFGIAAHINANATLDFCPPEREFIVCRARLPLIPKLPSIRLYSSIGLPTRVNGNHHFFFFSIDRGRFVHLRSYDYVPGKCVCNNSTGQTCMSNWST